MAEIYGQAFGEPEADWTLEGEDGRERRVRLMIGEGQLGRANLGVTLGRHPALCDMVVSDPTVSRRHLRVGRSGDGLFVEDVNSLNGTLIDGARLLPFEPVNLHPGAELTLGKVVLTFRRAGEIEDDDEDEELD